MRSRWSSHFAVGVGSASVGGALLFAGLFRAPFLAAAFLGTPVWALALTGGCVLVLAGVLVVVFASRGELEVPDVVPAHVAFRSRMIVPAMDVPAPRAAGASGGASARLAAPAPLAQRRVPPAADDLASLDLRIRALTRQINKAGVLLATGQLSQQGYVAYVEDLKRQRGVLEAQRVRVELRG